MHRTWRAILAVAFIVVIVVCAISISENAGRSLKADITEQQIYTLSQGSKAILAKLNQPIKLKLYYARTAAMKGPDQIRFFNNYYYFVRDLLEEYALAGEGMVKLEVIDPRPYSDDEQEALQYGLQRFQITEDENFFFGLVLQTEFGVIKTIDFFAPNRQSFVEYDISYLIDTAMTRQKKRIGVLSSLEVMGEEVTDYMAQMMRMQNQQPKPSWMIVEQLRQRYDVSKIATDAEEIKDVDILLVIHPKDLAEKTLFAIDQFVLAGGRTVVFVDPHCLADQPEQTNQRMGGPERTHSELNRLLPTWGLEMEPGVFAGDRELALRAPIRQNQRPEKLIGLLGLTKECGNPDSAISADLNLVRVLFAGALKPKLPAAITEGSPAMPAPPAIELTPLLRTTDKGNIWKVGSPYELMYMDAGRMMKYFTEGTEPVNIAYLATGRFQSSFPDGVTIPVEQDESKAPDQKAGDEQAEKPQPRHLTGLTEASSDCAVAVFADVDFISDMVAFQQTFFGSAAIGDNLAVVFNTIENLSGSGDLISIRSRGNFQRPFTRVDEIERQAEIETAEEEDRIKAEIAGFQAELNQAMAGVRDKKEAMLKVSELAQTRDIEVNIRRAEKRLRDLKNESRKDKEQLKQKLQVFCMLVAPAGILALTVVLSIHRGAKRRHYISHASDA